MVRKKYIFHSVLSHPLVEGTSQDFSDQPHAMQIEKMNAETWNCPITEEAVYKLNKRVPIQQNPQPSE